jgi:hypothetical protein
MIPTVSASKLQMFIKCQRQFYLKYVRELTMKEWTGAIMGSAIHHAISHKLQDPDSKEIPLFLRHYNAAIETIAAVDKYRNETPMRVTGLNIIREMDWERLKPLHDHNGAFVEREFLLPYPSSYAPKVYVHGIMDLVTEDYILIDHKSSKDLPTLLDVNIQFTIYHWAFEQLFQRTPKAIYWHHLRTKEMIPYTHQGYEHLDKVIDLYLKKQGKQMQAFKKKKKDQFCVRVCAFHDLCWK